MRLAAMYASFEDFKQGQPQAWEEAVYAKEDDAMARAFEDGTVDDYRTGGKWNVPLGTNPAFDRAAELKAKQRAAKREGYRLKSTANAIANAERFETCEAYLAAHGDRLSPEVVAAVREHFDAPLTKMDVLRAAERFRTFDQFAEACPRHAAAARRMGFAQALQECARHLSTITWQLERWDEKHASE